MEFINKGYQPDFKLDWHVVRDRILQSKLEREQEEEKQKEIEKEDKKPKKHKESKAMQKLKE
jgi:hypothetical protein